MTGCPTLKCLFGFDSIEHDESSDEETPKINNKMHNEDNEGQGQAELMGGGGSGHQHPVIDNEPPNDNKNEGPQQDFLGLNGREEALERPPYKTFSSASEECARSPSTRSAYGGPTTSDTISAISSCQLLSSSTAISDIVAVPSFNTPNSADSPELSGATHGARSQADVNGSDSKANAALFVRQAAMQMAGCHVTSDTTATCTPDTTISGTLTTQARRM